MVWLWLLCRPSASPRLPLSVFGKSDVSRGRGRREKAEKERGGKVLLNNKAWRPSREPSLASGVSLHYSLSLFPLLPSICSKSLFLSFSHTVFLNNLFPAEHPIFNWLSTVSYFEWTHLLLFLPLSLATSTLTCSFLSWSSKGGGAGLLHRRDKTSESRPLIYSGGVTLRLRRFAAVSHVVAFKEPGFKNVGHLK